MNKLIFQHIVNSVQVILGGLLIILMFADVDFGLNLLQEFKNSRYALYVFGALFLLIIITKQILKSKHKIDDPLVVHRPSKILIYVSYAVFAVFIFARAIDLTYKYMIALFGWGLQIVALVLSFFYKQSEVESNEEILDDQMMGS